ncbi:hypothetical protein ACIBO5_59190 [Nonomuraea angiospora]|uniref:hypothetical protein n=1 Tax=Nonomuraea angiospora TaxID=46172 RepID=UPI0029B08DD2|nr:hypothetical protein [Nonomuraea angiospora]MDX3100341.1 hypothetical protein [Nonomuraea angiospora]
MTRCVAAVDQFRKVRRLRADRIGPWLPVRPDGYVAVRSRSGDAVADYLRTILVA